MLESCSLSALLCCQIFSDDDPYDSRYTDDADEEVLPPQAILAVMSQAPSHVFHSPPEEPLCGSSDEATSSHPQSLGDIFNAPWADNAPEDEIQEFDEEKEDVAPHPLLCQPVADDLPADEPDYQPEGETILDLYAALKPRQIDYKTECKVKNVEKTYSNSKRIGEAHLRDIVLSTNELCFKDGTLCIFTGSYWARPKNEKDGIRRLRALIDRHFDLKGTLTQRDIKRLYADLQTSPDVSEIEDIPANKGLLNLQDAVLNLATGQVLPQKPEQYFFSFINISVADVLHPPTDGTAFEAFVSHASSGHPSIREMVLELFIMVHAGLHLKYYSWLQGDSNTGKSQLGRLLEISCGNEWFCCLRNANDFGDKWTIGFLAWSKMVGCWDMPDEPLSNLAISNIKMLVGADTMKGEVKGGSAFNVTEKPYLAMASNYPIRIKEIDKETALLNRMLVIPFFNPVGEDEMNLDLIGDLTEDLPYIFHEMIECYQRFAARNFQPTRVEIPEDMLPEEAHNDRSKVKSFVNTQVIEQAGATVSSDTLYSKFKEQEPDSELALVPFGKLFRSIVERQFLSAKKDRVYDENGTRCNGYRNICLRDSPLN